jgi:hypothetical protein
MKLYVDDIRIAPEGWEQAWNIREALKLLETQEVTHLSLDHDLGSSLGATGYDIMKWIELKVELEDFPLPEIKFHTANPTGRANMQAAYDAILRRQRNKGE